MERQIEHVIRLYLSSKGAVVPFVLEYPDTVDRGHITTNVALAASKTLKEKPFLIAEEIKKALTEASIPEIEKIEVAGAGFINIFFNRTYFVQIVKRILTDTAYGTNDSLKGKTYLYEYTDPNPFKEFHIGHLMANAVGEALSRLAETQGATVKRACYQGDVGPHIAKTLWAMKHVSRNDDESDITYLGRAYAYGANQYELNPQTKEEVDQLNSAVYAQTDEEIKKMYAWGRQVSLDHFEHIYKMLGTRFDHYFFESEMAERAVELVRSHVPTVFEESDGAIVYRGEKKGLHTRVFINSRGLPTYEAKELVLDLEVKPKVVPTDISVIVTASEQNDYFKVVLGAMEDINPEETKKIQHISHGMLRFKEGKMGSRKGNVIAGDRLVESVRKDIYERLQDKAADDSVKYEISEKIAVAAVKYSVLRQSLGSDVIFDQKAALSTEGDSGPYILYAYVRMQSILKKAEAERYDVKASLPPADVSEPELLLASFPHVVARAHTEQSPNSIVHYAVKLAGAFNAFYGHTKIIDADNPHTSYRLALTRACAHVLKKSLHIAGIETVDVM